MKNSPKSQQTLSQGLGVLLNKFAATLARAIIWIYQLIFSPSLGILRFFPFYPKPNCVFYPTCSEYAQACFKKYSFFNALHKTLHRIGRCHSGTPPQVDLP